MWVARIGIGADFIAELPGNGCAAHGHLYIRNLSFDRFGNPFHTGHCGGQKSRKTDEGALLENGVYLNLRKYGEIRYYQRRTGRELDFILPEMQTGIEVKQTGDARDIRRVAALAQGLNLKEQYVVTREFRDLPGLIPAQDL